MLLLLSLLVLMLLTPSTQTRHACVWVRKAQYCGHVAQVLMRVPRRGTAVMGLIGLDQQPGLDPTSNVQGERDDKEFCIPRVLSARSRNVLSSWSSAS